MLSAYYGVQILAAQVSPWNGDISAVDFHEHRRKAGGHDRRPPAWRAVYSSQGSLWALAGATYSAEAAVSPCPLAQLEVSTVFAATELVTVCQPVSVCVTGTSTVYASCSVT